MKEEEGVEDEGRRGSGEKKSTLKWGVIAVAVLLVLCAGMVVLILMKNSGTESQEKSPVSAAQSDPSSSSGNRVPLERFVVNLNDPGGKRFLKTRIVLEFTQDGFEEELNARLPQLRDAVLLILSSKTLEDVQGNDGKIALRIELIRGINRVLTNKKIRTLYYTEFVVQ